MMNIRRYTPADAPLWDAFVRDARNATFLFERAYMDYHQDRFQDHSLLFYNDKEVLVAVLPANANDRAIWSHQGLTYGGFVLNKKAHATEVGEMFDATRVYLNEAGIRSGITSRYRRCIISYPQKTTATGCGGTVQNW